MLPSKGNICEDPKAKKKEIKKVERKEDVLLIQQQLNDVHVLFLGT